MIIDTHCHAGEFKRHFPEAFARVMMRSVGKPPEAITIHIPELLAGMDEAGIDRAFLLAFDAERTLGVKVPNDYVAEICRTYPLRFFGFCSVDVGTDGALGELELCVTVLGLRGLKIAPAYLMLTPDDRLWYPIYEAAAAYGLPVLVHTRRTPAHGGWIRYGRPSFQQVAKDFPDLRLIMAHMSVPWVEQCLELLAGHPNLYADLSIFGWFQSIEKLTETLAQARKLGVIGQILWGTDFPWGPTGPFLKRMERLCQEPQLFPDGLALQPSEWEALMGKTALELITPGKGRQL